MTTHPYRAALKDAAKAFAAIQNEVGEYASPYQKREVALGACAACAATDRIVRRSTKAIRAILALPLPASMEGTEDSDSNSIGDTGMADRSGEGLRDDAPKHTPGPWRHDGMGHVIVGGHTVVATVSPIYVGADQAAANTLLITAAPDLLEVLTEISNEGMQEGLTDALRLRVESALAKAVGDR